MRKEFKTIIPCFKTLNLVFAVEPENSGEKNFLKTPVLAIAVYLDDDGGVSYEPVTSAMDYLCDDDVECDNFVGYDDGSESDYVLEKRAKDKLEAEAKKRMTHLSVRDKLQAVLAVIADAEKADAMISDEELYPKLQEKYGFAKAESMRILKVLLRDGLVYSPKTGYYRKT